MPSTFAPFFFSRSQNSQYVRGKCGDMKTKFINEPLPFSHQIRQKIYDLLLPPRPIVIDVITPKIHPGMNPLFSENIPEPRRRHPAFILPLALTDTKHHLLLIIQIHIRMIRRKPREKIHRRIPIQRLIHPTVEKIPRIVNTRHRQHAGKKLRPAEKRDHRMRRAHTAPRRNRKDAARLRADKGQNLLDDIIVIRFLPRRAPLLIAPYIRP